MKIFTIIFFAAFVVSCTDSVKDVKRSSSASGISNEKVSAPLPFNPPGVKASAAKLGQKTPEQEVPEEVPIIIVTPSSQNLEE